MAHKIKFICKVFIWNFKYRKTLCLSPPNDQNFSKLRRGGLDNGYKFFLTF